MDERIFFNLSRLIQVDQQLAQGCDTISFDIFDTLFIRRVHDPDMLKVPVARYIAARAEQQGLKWSWQKIQKLRDTFEAEQRVKTGQKFEDHEACYPVYMRQVLAAIFGDSQADVLLAEVTEYELAVENSMLVPRQQLVDWLRRLHGLGKKIFLISDIYLPAAHLRKLVEFGGFAACVTDIVSSADSFLAKASGKGFALVQKKYDLDVKTWLHIGDNPVSDGYRPSQAGIKALVLKDGLEKMRKGLVRRYWQYGQGRPFFRGRALVQVMQPLEEENRSRSPLYIEGYNFLAPLIGAFIQRLAEKTLQDKIPHIYFLSREGWMFQKFWDGAIPNIYPATKLPSVSYLYVSRMALAGACCAYQGLTKDNAAIAFLPAGNRDFRDICRIFKLDGGKLAPHLARHHLSLESSLSPLYPETTTENSVHLQELLEDEQFQAEVRSQTRPYNDALIKYLEQEHFFEQTDVAIVDIGWLGTIQRFLYESVQHRPDRPRFHGMLLAATRGIPFPTRPDNSIEGLIYDRDRFDLGGSSILYARDLFEEACRAPHPTLNGYRLTEDGCELEFRTQDDATGKAEQIQDAYFAPLQQGILDAAPFFGAAASVLGYQSHDLKPWLNHLLVAKLAFPRTSEVRNIRHQHHLDDFHGRNEPSKKHRKADKHLWDFSLGALRWNPWLRLKFFILMPRERLKE
jgi:FMN phosphatase YigB (HAD superfamily)